MQGSAEAWLLHLQLAGPACMDRNYQMPAIFAKLYLSEKVAFEGVSSQQQLV